MDKLYQQRLWPGKYGEVEDKHSDSEYCMITISDIKMRLTV